MAIQSFIADEATLKEAGTSRLEEFGHLKRISHTVRQPVDASHSIGQGPAAQELLDNVAEIMAQLHGEPPTLECLQVFGTYTDNGDGTYTITPDNTLPEHTFKQQAVDGGGTATISGFKFGSYTLRAEQGGSVRVETEGMGKNWDGFDDSETVSTPSPAGGPRRFFDGKVKIDGTVVGSIESFTQDFNRNLEAIKGLEDDATGEKREPSAIIEKLFDISGNIVVNIENGRAWEEAMNDSSSPYELQDDRSTVDIKFVLDSEAGTDTHTIQSCLFDEISHEKNDDGEKRTAAIAFVGSDWKTDGDIL